MMKLLASALLLAVQSFAQTEANLGCITELALPVYPMIALLSQTRGEVIAAVTVNADGQGEVALEGPAMLRSAVKEQFDNARFDPVCRGKVVRLTFRFEITGVASDSTAIKRRTVFVAPNIYKIQSETLHFQPEFEYFASKK